jgi:2-(1,2-epoxy-1,2-dihydrophenyl)acetyl-CoA isomerase
VDHQGWSAIILRRYGAVLELRLNRPDTLNAIEEAMARELQKGVKLAGADPGCRCLVITGSGRGFCSGQFLGASVADDGPLEDVGGLVRTRYNPLISALRDLPIPVIAAVNGVAVGAGFSLALAADIRVAADSASFSCGFAKIGLIPDSGASFFLPRYLGLPKALELAVGGERLSATDAAALGLVARVYPSDTFDHDYVEFANAIAQGPTRAFALTKAAFNRGLQASLEDQLETEAELQDQASKTKDFRAALAAFREKRPARFLGH